MVHEHHKVRICPTLADNLDLSVHWGRGGGIYGHNISLLTLPFAWMHCLLVAFPSRWQVQEQAWFGSTTWGGGVPWCCVPLHLPPSHPSTKLN